jgi:tRNA-splicing ligase RtcB
MTRYNYIPTERKAIKAFTGDMPIEPQAMEQLRNIASMPFIHKHVAVMPDVHLGKGATVGSVIATKGVIVPAAVGVDLGCGMMAVQTSLRADQLPDNLHDIRTHIEAVVPHGRTNNGDVDTDKGAFRMDTLPGRHFERTANLRSRYLNIVSKHPKIEHAGTFQHMGTLGGGNHFVELCLDENDMLWVMLHSGSRGPGNKIGSYFIEKAKEEMRRYHIDQFLPDQDLSYLVEHSEIFDDYVEALMWAQDFAAENRKAMMDATLKALQDHNDIPPFKLTEMAVNCHHNYAQKEHHYGENIWITRKGAVRARKGDLGIIPGSMGAKSFIVEGLGNQDSFCSCSHGAGRVMSRTEAKKRISLAEHVKATAGIECRKDADVIDESPAAYKDIDAVMAAQDELVKIRYTLRQIVNIKG